MAGEWMRFHFPYSRQPEEHWQREVMGRGGWLAVTLALSSDVAREVLAQLEDNKVAPFTRLSFLGDTPIAVSDGMLALAQAQLAGPESEGGVVFDLTLPPDALQALLESAKKARLNILAIGEAPAGGYGAGDPPEVPVIPVEGSVLMAIIDDGIGIANRRFRDKDGETRLLEFVDLDAHEGARPIPRRVWPVGRINRLLCAHPDDDEAVYREMGMIDTRSDRRQPLRYSTSHGTHVMDLFAGYDCSDPEMHEEAARRPIIAVQLPSRTIEDRSDTLMPTALREALAHIFLVAIRARARDGSLLPLVLNFSFGVLAGPHDGTSSVERILASFLCAYRWAGGHCELVLPAGNRFQAQTVAAFEKADFDGADGRERRLSWNVLPDDRTSSFVQIWGPRRECETQQLAVWVEPPCDPPAIVTSEAGQRLDWVVDGRVIASIYHQLWLGRERITIALRPTAEDGGDLTGCPSSLWTIGIRDLGLDEGARVDLRIQRDDPVTFRRSTGRQSYFEHVDFVEFDPLTGRRINTTEGETGSVIRKHTLSAYVPNPELVVVGGFRRSDGDYAIYSAAGPVTRGRHAPDLAAPTEESPSHGGVLATGTATNSVYALNGTSVAAPAVAREIARRLAAADSIGEQRRIVDVLKAEVRRLEDDPDCPIAGPHGAYGEKQDDRDGHGRFRPTAPAANRRRIDEAAPQYR